MLVYDEFIKEIGYIYEIRKSGNTFDVYNSKRKENRIDRDGIPYIEKSFNTLKEAKKYLKHLKNIYSK